MIPYWIYWIRHNIFFFGCECDTKIKRFTIRMNHIDNVSKSPLTMNIIEYKRENQRTCKMRTELNRYIYIYYIKRLSSGLQLSARLINHSTVIWQEFRLDSEAIRSLSKMTLRHYIATTFNGISISRYNIVMTIPVLASVRIQSGKDSQSHFVCCMLFAVHWEKKCDR